ncbi:SusC/RagA family TonB-linked outer membrane protein [Chryseobacterium bernardetii]|uniref:SusC/RagA family TonB-linked outer membrane protein n=1 Tax=Chryseobacterium bernardetii TaxID=1241978 RepID=UPI000F50FC1D|nr:SusC/RagA family TonB-linked outer membrane protein [Chryseobacterium bernardetii]AZB35025.1 SusC/RagA family TonB-linked outer membrane protein [Chryseobacterium bernardetii]
MNVKLRVLSAGALFFLGQTAFAQTTKKDTAKATQIEEVVMVGFGQKKTVKELTGAVGTVSGKSIAQSSSSASIERALSGSIAGVQTGAASGQPGGFASIRVRGVSSINGNNNPIIILDGVRINQGDLTQNSTTANILANLNSSDFESVTVLKDAVSTAIYGADAGAGVVIITTKKGGKGKARFNLSFEQGVASTAIKMPKGLTTEEWKGLMAAQIANNPSRVAANPGLTAAMVPDLALQGKFGGTYQYLYSQDHNADWFNAIQSKGGYFQTFNGSISGGSDKMSYFSSLGYYDQNSIIKNSYFKRVTNSNRIEYKATDKLTLSTDIQLSYSEISTLNTGGTFSNPLVAYLFNWPTDPVFNEDGSYNLGSEGSLSNGLFNSAFLQKTNYQKAKTARAFANLQAEYKILDNLTYRFVFAPEYINIEEDSYNTPLHGDGYSYKGRLYSYATRYFNFNVQNILSYNKTFGDKHNVSASLIQEAYSSQQRTIGGGAQTVGATFLKTLDSFVTPITTIGNRFKNSRAGYAATVHYDYDKFLLLDASVRRDNLSNFWPGQKDGTFWSVGAGVDLAKLNGISDSKVISQMKFIASYGQVGNQLPNYMIPYTLYRYTANYNDDAGATIINVDNPNLSWEKVNPFNVGLDVGFLNNRLMVSAAYYHKKTKDLATFVPLSPSQGGLSETSPAGAVANARIENVGDMVNKGFELTINANIFNNPDGFSWKLGVNGTINQNEITSIYGGADVINGTNILRVGEAVNSFYMRKWAGVDPSNGNPLWYVNGVDGATTSDYNQAQRAVQGNRMPKYFGGANTQLSYKGFTIDAQMSFGFGNKIYDSWANYLFSDGQYTLNYPGYGAQLDYWTPNNPNALNPKPIEGGNRGTGTTRANAASSRFLYKGDYLRLRTLKVSYNFKGDMLRGTGLNNVEVYVLGNNIWTYLYDKNLQYDPDLQLGGTSTALGGTSNLDLPALKTYSLGVNLSF